MRSPRAVSAQRPVGLPTPRLALGTLRSGLVCLAVAGGPSAGWRVVGNAASAVGTARASVTPSPWGEALTLAGGGSPTGRVTWPVSASVYSHLLVWANTGSTATSQVAMGGGGSEWLGSAGALYAFKGQSGGVTYVPGEHIVQVVAADGASSSMWTSKGGGTPAVVANAITSVSVANYGGGFDAPGRYVMAAAWSRRILPQEAAELIRDPYILLAGGMQ